MPWLACPGDVACNRCRRPLEVDEGVYQGERTKAQWCRPCAEGLGFDGGPVLTEAFVAMSELNKRELAKAEPAFTASMRALKARAAMKIAPERSWTGERDAS